MSKYVKDDEEIEVVGDIVPTVKLNTDGSTTVIVNGITKTKKDIDVSIDDDDDDDDEKVRLG